MKTILCLVLLCVFHTCLSQYKRNDKDERRTGPYPAYKPGGLPTYLSYLHESKGEGVPLPMVKSYPPQSTNYNQEQSQDMNVNGYLRYLGDSVNYIKQVIAGILYRLRALEVCKEEDLPTPKNGKRSCSEVSSSSSSYYPGGGNYGNSYGNSYGNNYASDQLECEVRCDNGYGFPRTSTSDPTTLEFTCENGKWDPNTIVQNCQPLCSKEDLVEPEDGSIDCTSAGSIPFKCTAACDIGYGFPGLVARMRSGGDTVGYVGTITATCTDGVRWDRTWFPVCEKRCERPDPANIPTGAIVTCDPEPDLTLVSGVGWASVCDIQCPDGKTWSATESQAYVECVNGQWIGLSGLGALTCA